MEVGAAIDIYTTVLGWTLYDRLWEALADTGIAYLPFLGAVARHFVESWRDEGHQGAEQSVRGLESRLAAMLAVAALAGAPALDVRVADLSHTAACGAATVGGNNTGTLYDSAFKLGDQAARVPVWWRAVMAVASGLSNVAVASIPCAANLRQLNYRMENARVTDPELRQQLALFDRDCFQPAVAKFAREHQSLPVAYANDDLNWYGSKYFLDTAGFYDDGNANLAPRAREELPGFPYDADLGGRLASGLGRPTCKQWWADAANGLRKRLLDTLDPQALQAAKTAATGAATALAVENALIKRIAETSTVFVGKNGSGIDMGGTSMAVRAVGMFGVAWDAIEKQASLWALKQAAPIAQSLILMAVYLCLPFALVFSSYSIETILITALGIFAIRFLTALWALAAWVDNVMPKALGIEWWRQGSWLFEDKGPANVITAMVGYLLFVGLPVVWFLGLGWAGHNLAAGGVVGSLTDGIGRAAAGGVRAGAKLARGMGKGGAGKGGAGKK